MDKRVDLSRRRRTVIGTAGSVKVVGDGVMPRHAEIAVYESAAEPITAIRPLAGLVSVERRGRIWRLTGPWPLADGDVVIIGSRRLTYRDLGSPLEPLAQHGERKEVVPWLL